MKKKKPSKRHLVKNMKETPDARKVRVSSGVKYRASVFADKRRKLREKLAMDKLDDER